MNLLQRCAMIVVAVFALLALAGCGGTPAQPAQSEEGAGTVLEISTDGEALAFSTTSLETQAGEPVTLRFTNSSTALQHNWVLVDGGEDVAQQVNQAGVAAGPEQAYVDESAGNVIAHTELLDPGAVGEVTFTAPDAGTYEYICTVPGHYPLMRGTLTVQP